MATLKLLNRIQTTQVDWRLAIPAIFLINFVLYFGIWNFGFVYDDLPYIVDNPVVHSLTPLHKFFTEPASFTASFFDPQVYRPIAALANAVEWRFFGNNPAGYHVVNFLLHLLNTGLVYWFLSLLFKKRWLAILGALFFSIHPTATEVVDWVATQNSQIWLAFFLLSLIVICRAKPIVWLSLIFWGLAMLTKETAFFGVFIFPLVFYFREGQDWRKWKVVAWRFLPYLLLGIAYFFVRRSLPGGTGVGEWGTILMAPALLHKYISLVFWPVNFIASYDIYSNFPVPTSFFDIRVLFGCAEAMILLGWLVFALRKKWTPEIFGITWFLIFLLPILQLIMPTVNIIGERVLYAPMIGLVAAILSGASRGIEILPNRYKDLGKAVASSILLAYSIFFCAQTFIRHWDWRNEKTLWESALKVDSKNINAYLGLAHYYLSEGKNPEQTRRIAEWFLQYWPDHTRMKLVLASALLGLEEYPEAEKEYLWVQKVRPEYEEAFNGLQEVYQRTGVKSGILLNFKDFRKKRIQIFRPGDSSPLLTHGVINEEKLVMLLRPNNYYLKAGEEISQLFKVGEYQFIEIEVN